jgi:hypothetical protein
LPNREIDTTGQRLRWYLQSDIVADRQGATGRIDSDYRAMIVIAARRVVVAGATERECECKQPDEE